MDISIGIAVADFGMTVPVADLGIAKFLVGDDSSIIRASMIRTLGYMAPGTGT